MSAVPEDVVTSDPSAVTTLETTPETIAGPSDTPAQEAAAPAQTAPEYSAPPSVVDAASDFESLMNESEQELSEGEVVIGTVVHIDKDGVLVDVGSKSEGIIRPNELSREHFDNIHDVVKVGDPVKVVVIGRDAEDGNLLLSKKRADFEKAWDKVMDALNEGTVIHAMVTERVKGGLVVDLGIRGFVPASHVGSGDFKHQNLDKFVGQSVPLKVIEVDRDRRKVVLSHRLATQEEREQRKTDTISSLKEGDIRRGIVRRVTDYGAFIDLGGIDGLLHVSEMSWARVKHPSEVVRNGQELDVMVLKLRLDQGRISLGLRQILPDPWSTVSEKYKVGDTIKATVSRLVPFGAFVGLEEGVEAIIPNSELSDRRVAKPSDVVNPGDEVDAMVIEMRPDERKMTLSMRRLIEASAPREPYMENESPNRGGRPERSDRDGGRSARRSGRGGRDSGGDTDDDYKEYKNYRATQREETFGTSLADVLGDHFGTLEQQAEAAEAETAAAAATEEAAAE
jgi:ribosomal protein S1